MANITIQAPHWKQEAYQLMKDLENVATNPSVTKEQQLQYRASMGQRAMEILIAALAETDGEAETQCWSEGVRFGILQFVEVAHGVLPPNSINLIVNRMVQQAMRVKKNAMADSTEAKRLTAALQQVWELLDMAPSSTLRSEDGDRLLQAKDEALAILTDALEEARPLHPARDSEYSPL